jgi:hypothetical protein
MRLLAKKIKISTKDVENYETQFRSEYFILNKHIDNKQAYYVQKAVNRNLYLGPNEVFFNKTTPLTVHKKQASQDTWNQNKEFDFIYNLKQKDNVMYWPLYFSKKRRATIVYGHMTLKKDTKLVALFDNTHTLTMDLKKNPDNDTNGYTFIIKIGKTNPGFHTLQIRLTEDTDIGRLHYIKLRSRSDIYIVRERWRPLAAHASFYNNSKHTTDAWIMSVQPINPTLGSFSPLTTPFGYYGAVIKANGSSSGVNFSLWSYGRGKPRPPTYKLSRLLAIGDPYALFGEYGHEGTGVKIRNLQPWTTNTSQIYTLALKFKPDPDQIYKDGQIYTYFSYYWDELNELWKLYGIGEQFRSKNQLFKSLTLGSFVEVPGIAETQRTNHIERTVQFNGYSHNDTDGKWRKINSMKMNYTTTDYKDGHTNKQWHITDDNKFTLTAGGMKQYEVDKYNRVLTLPTQEDDDHIPIHMHPSKLAKLDEPIPYPRIVSHHIAEITTRGEKIVKTLKLIIEIPNKDYMNNNIYVYCGPDDGLTILSEWPKKYYKFSNITTGTTGIELPYIEENKYYRVLVKDKSMQIWNRNTYII